MPPGFSSQNTAKGLFQWYEFSIKILEYDSENRFSVQVVLKVGLAEVTSFIACDVSMLNFLQLSKTFEAMHRETVSTILFLFIHTQLYSS